MLIVDKHCSDVCCDEFPVPHTNRKSQQVKEHSDTENFICNQYGEKLGWLEFAGLENDGRSIEPI